MSAWRVVAQIHGVDLLVGEHMARHGYIDSRFQRSDDEADLTARIGRDMSAGVSHGWEDLVAMLQRLLDAV